MRWSVFFVFAYLLLALETGLDKLLAYGTTTPSLLLILAVFVGLSAPPMTVWSRSPRACAAAAASPSSLSAFPIASSTLASPRSTRSPSLRV